MDADTPSPNGRSWVEKTQEAKPRVLLVDDTASAMHGYAYELERRGFEVVKAYVTTLKDKKLNAAIGFETGSDFISFPSVEDVRRYALNAANKIDAVLTDLRMPEVGHGVMLVAQLKMGDRFRGPVITHSSLLDQASAQSLRNYNVTAMFGKGQWDEITDTIHTHLQSGIVPD